MIHIYFGDGKGKTTAAVGQGIRAAGWGLRVIMVQFQKSMRSGETEFLGQFDKCSGFSFKVIRPETVNGFFWKLTEEQKLQLKKDAENAVEMICGIINEGECDLLILDEILGVVKNGTLTDNDVMKIIKCRSDGLELILTGREASERIRGAADYVTEMKCVKHPFQKGVKARKGVEF